MAMVGREGIYGDIDRMGVVKHAIHRAAIYDEARGLTVVADQPDLLHDFSPVHAVLRAAVKAYGQG